MAVMTRRGALGSLGAMLGSSAAGGCGWLTGELDAKLPDPDPNTPLTIDAHSHVFNLSDSQFAEFVRKAHPDQAWIIDMLGELGKIAPKADHELALLDTPSLISFTDLRDQQYQEAKESIEVARKHLEASSNPRKRQSSQIIADKLHELPRTYAGYKALRRSERPLRLKAAQQRRRAALTRLSPAAATAATAERCSGGTTETIDPNAVFDFVLRNFHYRYANVHDYVEEYSAGPQRKIDIMVTQIIDYDWPLGQLGTPSSLTDQVKVMERIMRLTNGRVLNFAPFCPFKQVAWGRRIPGVQNPMNVVQDAILKRGHVGVKIYPPMGFLPYGNKHLPPGFWNGTPVRGELLDAQLSEDLDSALDVLYTWCLANHVPVMAHTSPGNVADCRYIDAIMPPQRWRAAIEAYPGLRVNFAHFGHTDIVANHHQNAEVLARYMNQGPNGWGRHLYADSGYFAEVLTEQDKLEQELGALLRSTAHKGDAALSRRLMYGTDWEMVIIEGGTTGYLDLFERVMGDLARDPTINPKGDLADRFFGLNAAAYLGLRKGEANRWRLERFFGSRTLPWMVKLDKAGDTTAA